METAVVDINGVTIDLLGPVLKGCTVPCFGKKVRKFLAAAQEVELNGEDPFDGQDTKTVMVKAFLPTDLFLFSSLDGKSSRPLRASVVATSTRNPMTALYFFEGVPYHPIWDDHIIVPPLLTAPADMELDSVPPCE